MMKKPCTSDAEALYVLKVTSSFELLYCMLVEKIPLKPYKSPKSHINHKSRKNSVNPDKYHKMLQNFQSRTLFQSDIPLALVSHVNFPCMIWIEPT